MKLSLDALKAFEIDQVVANNVIGGWGKTKKSKKHKGHSASNSVSGGHYHGSAASISVASYSAPSVSNSGGGGHHYSTNVWSGYGKSKKWKW